MLLFTTLLETDWDQLTHDLAVTPAAAPPGQGAASCRWSRWQQLEPVLAGVQDVEHLRTLVWDTSPEAAETSNALVGALLRLAGVQGHDDTVAAKVVGLLMAPGCARLVSSLNRRVSTGSSHAVPSAVIAALWEHVRTAPLGGWRRYAANLMWSVRRTVEREFGVRAEESCDVMTTAPSLESLDSLDDVSLDIQDRPRVGDVHRTELEWAGLLAWARENHVLDEDAIALLVDLVAARITNDDLVETRVVAAARGVSVRTVTRRRSAALQALKDALHSTAPATTAPATTAPGVVMTADPALELRSATCQDLSTAAGVRVPDATSPRARWPGPRPPGVVGCPGRSTAVPTPPPRARLAGSAALRT